MHDTVTLALRRV